MLPCFVLNRSHRFNHVHAYGLLRIELPCPLGKRCPLPCINFKNLACPAERLSGSAGRAYTERCGFESRLRQLFSLLRKKGVVFRCLLCLVSLTACSVVKAAGCSCNGLVGVVSWGPASTDLLCAEIQRN